MGQWPHATQRAASRVRAGNRRSTEEMHGDNDNFSDALSSFCFKNGGIRSDEAGDYLGREEQ